MTNFEMIKNMSKKELAEFIDEISNTCPCSCCDYGVGYGFFNNDCIEGFKNWLEIEIEL
ncbi:TPA: hypothetical protein KO112_003525 [Clostridioides difficile]|uniref:hypothetical protein n=1 Tax=Clostridioides difficile TaxID=1496 RepID=UPI0010B4917A|nr:hypothetical protein [Clostridioides difficile]MBJ9771239.1 hypothetical protein [Clostridioides difficile]VIG74983.1 Uncharacterised protein [Clostridioides difficile]HBF8744585.1 hypothetical protein [Clostridioides difficile]HBG0166728.1 hypothetical protein [Clostridioides difficile]HCJ2880985.1 hypothetical protein [Clostridioides difficile]